MNIPIKVTWNVLSLEAPAAAATWEILREFKAPTR